MACGLLRAPDFLVLAQVGVLAPCYNSAGCRQYNSGALPASAPGCTARLRLRRSAMPELPGGTVTFLFTDIEGSTKRWEAYPEAMAVALAGHDAIMYAAIEG